MHSYTVTIGRNVGSQPMSDTRWAEFIESTQMLLDDAGTSDPDSYVETHLGAGRWANQTEESAKVTLLSVEGLSQGTLVWLKKSIAYFSEHYQQDAIALTIGESDLIYA